MESHGSATKVERVVGTGRHPLAKMRDDSFTFEARKSDVLKVMLSS